MAHCINDAYIIHGILTNAKKSKDVRSNNIKDERF